MDQQQRLAGFKVLLGEPGEERRQDLTELVMTAGAQVHAVGDLDALVAEVQWGPDVVLTAAVYQLGMTALEAIRTINARPVPPRILVIMEEDRPLWRVLEAAGAYKSLLQGQHGPEDILREIADAPRLMAAKPQPL